MIFNNLTSRIFAIFWLTLALILLIVLMLPKFDERQFLSLSYSDTKKVKEIKAFIDKNVQDQLWTGEQRALRQAVGMAQEKWANDGLHITFMANNGRFVNYPSREMMSVRNFINLSDELDNPMKRRYPRLEILGPFATMGQYEQHQYYIIYKNRTHHPFLISFLLDKPIFLLALTMLISTPLLLWLAWSLAKPARRLKVAADTVAKGQLEQQPELESGPAEFRAVGISFNQMVAGLHRMITAQQRLISDISHELRTPLTRLQLATALMRRKKGESPELERIETEALRLEAMINNLLQLSRNRYKNEFDKEPLSADELWSDVLDNAEFEAEQMGKRLTITHAPQNSIIMGNRAALDSSLENIIRNALKYSYHLIEVSFQLTDGGLTILVDDDGPGLSAEERRQIFRPFYRTDEARDRNSGGTGLGLAIVESAVALHDGSVSAQESPLGGLRIRLWLPLAK